MALENVLLYREVIGDEIFASQVDVDLTTIYDGSPVMRAALGHVDKWRSHRRTSPYLPTCQHLCQAAAMALCERLATFLPDTLHPARRGSDRRSTCNLWWMTAESTHGLSKYGIAKNKLDMLWQNTLIPGMPVEVQIQTGSHAPLDYILRPFLDFIERGMKE